MVEQQFEYVILDGGRSVLETYRHVAEGDKKFPSLNIFLVKLRDKRRVRESAAKGKDPIA
jgi:hypothetical protein